MKLRIYEIHIFELQNKEINVKKILAVIDATYAVAKRKPENIRLARKTGLAGKPNFFRLSFCNCISCELITARIFFTFIHFKSREKILTDLDLWEFLLLT